MSKLIPLESLKAFLKSRRFTEEKNGWYVLSLSPAVIDELDALATIDPIATIDEMIEDIKEEDKDIDSLDDMDMWISIWKSIILKRLKERLFPNPELILKNNPI